MLQMFGLLLMLFPKKVVKVGAKTPSLIFKKKNRGLSGGSVVLTSDNRESSVYVWSIVNKGLSDPLVNRRPPLKCMVQVLTQLEELTPRSLQCQCNTQCFGQSKYLSYSLSKMYIFSYVS